MIRDTLKALSRPKFVLLNTLRYLFGVIDKRHLNKICTPKEKLFADALLVDGYFLKNCKLYFYKALKTKKANYKQYEISRDDALCLRSCCSILRKEVNVSWDYKTLQELDECIKYISSSSAKLYMSKFINKKLSFLIRSYGLSYHDIIADMTYCAIMAVYRCYPRIESDKHAENLMKHAIHNAGLGIIMHHTKSCRNMLYKDSDGLFQHKMREISTVGEIPYYDRKDLDDTSKSIRELMQRMQKPVTKQFMNLAIGNYDMLFSKFLGMDNREYLEKARYSSYIAKVRKYMNLDKKRVEDFFIRLRKHL